MTKPCSGCGGNGKPIFTDGDDFWKWDPETEQYRVVDYYGSFYPLHTHPGATEQGLVEVFGSKLYLGTEQDIIWRTIRLMWGALLMANML